MHMDQFHLIIILVTPVKLKSLGAVYHLIAASYIRLPSTEPAKF